ncbi:MAG: hypothetical protein K2I93_02735, partial [Oscillospiraceae bacterium]|nr:hypothetical protein [Oscillospiraceae bacterium]
MVKHQANHELLFTAPKGEEVFHAEPIQHTSFLHHIGISMAACVMLAVGIGSIWAFKTAAPIPDPMESIQSGIPDTASAVPHDETVLSIPDFSDKPTYYTFIEGTGVFKNEYQPNAFAFSLTSDEQRTLSSVISSCAWRELSDTPLFEGVSCLVLDFDNSVLEIWMNPSTEDNTFDVRYMADKETGEQTWYEADTQAYQDIMGVVGPYITAQLNSGIVDCIPNILYDTDLRFSFVSGSDSKDRFYLINDKLLDMLVYAFSNVKWGYDLYRENTDVNAWQTDTFLPAQSPTYCLYVLTPDNELYRCTVWLDTNDSDQIEFLRYTEDRLVGSRYSIEFDSDMKEALAACAEEHIYGGYVPDKPDEFYTVTMWDDLLLPIEELDFSLYKNLLAEFNEEHGTELEMPFSGEVDEAELRSLSVMSPEDFLEFLNSYTIGVGEVAEVFNNDQEQVMLKPLGNAIRMAEEVKVMYAELAPNANTIIHHYALSNSNTSDADIVETLAY